MRRRRAEKRVIIPDSAYGSIILSKFINKVMYDGKKNVAQRVIYDALAKFSKRVNTDNALEAF